jgi:hypothetical protein
MQGSTDLHCISLIESDLDNTVRGSHLIRTFNKFSIQPPYLVLLTNQLVSIVSM